MLTEKANLHPTYVGLVERFLRNPSLNAAQALATALGVRLSKLVVEAEAIRGIGQIRQSPPLQRSKASNISQIRRFRTTRVGQDAKALLVCLLFNTRETLPHCHLPRVRTTRPLGQRALGR